MTNERLLKKLNEIKNTMEVENGKHKQSYGLISDLCKSIESDLRLDITKQTKGASAAKRQKSAEKYLKGNYTMTGREWTQYAFDVNYDGNNYQCMLNGYTAFMFNDDGRLDLPNTPSDIEKPDIIALYKSLLNNTIDITEFFNIDDIKLYSKSISKGDYIKKPYVIEIADGAKIGFNIGYLMSIYEILGGNIKFYTGKNPSITTLRCESENGTALICPVKLKK